ncbi:uncharacterized protein B0I36DRAFT_390589 [Microdochium trichocladiopsis]|uniref:Uncharacterized protein n=1 Tax=Microdochium trichocladiopsis TaxID=1682393 RepID=A0A9P9BZ79_9PEZI|nr:uncharacterized protein B0I36DRAFT_390589 [Microdochium trichocladiopsis]KAH7039824.1 hypothetical protein B0I36DRAFT_390589 [Microdochium trichocladiopsis]
MPKSGSRVRAGFVWKAETAGHHVRGAKSSQRGLGPKEIGSQSRPANWSAVAQPTTSPRICRTSNRVPFNALASFNKDYSMTRAAQYPSGYSPQAGKRVTSLAQAKGWYSGRGIPPALPGARADLPTAEANDGGLDPVDLATAAHRADLVGTNATVTGHALCKAPPLIKNECRPKRS